MIHCIGYNDIGRQERFYSSSLYGRHYRDTLFKEDCAVQLWMCWFTLVRLLRPACTRLRSFLWLTASLVGFSIRDDLVGVTSIARACGHDRMVDFFHSSAVKLDVLTRMWCATALSAFPSMLKVNGRILIVGDGLKVPKAGKKMPAVKSLHQQSESNTKPEYIMGHSCQAVALLVGALQSVFAVPLASRIHEGVVFSNRDQSTLLDKMMLLVNSLGLPAFYFIADAYYSARKVMASLLKEGNHLISQVRITAVAYLPADVVPTEERKRGKPKKYGEKIPLKTLFDNPGSMHEAESPVYGEKRVMLRYRSADLLVRRLGVLVRFVAVAHPTRGKWLLLCTDLTLPAIEIIRLYGLRFKIEVSFKQALRTIGSYAYHFWMKIMTPTRRKSGDQYLHRKPQEYRKAVRKKIDAYHRFIQIGLIAQGLLQYLSVSCPDRVWAAFGSWLRTIRPGVPPSEHVTSMALRNSYPDYLLGSPSEDTFTIFLLERMDMNKAKALRLAA